jgi:hypothetical protein
LTSRRAAQLISTLAEVQAMLADGWQIDPPVIRKRVPDRLDGDWHLDIILWRDGRVKLLTLHDEPAAHSLLSKQGVETPAGS